MSDPTDHEDTQAKVKLLIVRSYGTSTLKENITVHFFMGEKSKPLAFLVNEFST